MSDKIFEPNTFNLNSILEKAFEVPWYQRPYSWNAKENVLGLLSDIYGAYHSFLENKSEFYFTGPFYYNYKSTFPGGTDCYWIIDGQQRIATYALMFISLYSLYKVKKIKDINSQFSSLEKSQLWKNNGTETDRNLKFISLNSLDKDFFIKIFDKAFDDPKKLKQYIEKYNTTSTSEERIKENFLTIYKFYENNIFNDNGISLNYPQTYLNFLLKRVQMIGIRSDISKKKIFEMFESINSKFKPLDEIDLIKTYIFKNIPEDEYDSMLSRWSELIKETDDRLEEYLKVYVKAYLFYSSQDITAKKFENQIVSHIKEKFELKTNHEAVIKLIEELEYWLPSYKAMISLSSSSSKLASSKEFETYFRIFTMLNYEHPKPLIFRSMCSLQEEKTSLSDVIKVWKFSTLYMLIFKSIMNQDSKSSISVFSKICNDIIVNNNISIKFIVEAFNSSLASKSITKESCISVLQNLDLFNKPIGFPILSLIQSIDIRSDEERKNAIGEELYQISKIDYGKTITYLQQFKKDVFETDHIMAQTPPKDSNLKYRLKKGNFGNEHLILLEGHDFPSNINGTEIKSDMSYKTFKELTINRLGNLRLVTKHVNTTKNNKATYLDDESSFTTYEEMIKRGKRLANYFFKCSSTQIK